MTTQEAAELAVSRTPTAELPPVEVARIKMDMAQDDALAEFFDLAAKIARHRGRVVVTVTVERMND